MAFKNIGVNPLLIGQREVLPGETFEACENREQEAFLFQIGALAVVAPPRPIVAKDKE